MGLTNKKNQRIQLLLALLVGFNGNPSFSGVNVPPAKFEVRPSMAPDASIALFLNRFREIKIGFTHNPGNGHLAASRLVMNRLRDLGYRGKFQIYYDELAAEKLSYLLPGFDPEIEGVQELPRLNATAQQMKHFEYGVGNDHHLALPPERFPGNSFKSLALIGGDDLDLSPESMDADVLLAIQPSHWGEPEVRIRSVRGSPEYTSYNLDKLKSQIIRDPVPVPIHRVTFVESELRGPALGHKIPGLREVVRQIDSHEVMTVYGVGYMEGPVKLATAIRATMQIQKEGKVPSKKGLVVPMLSNFNDEEWEKFHQHFDGEERLRLKIHSASDPDLDSVLKNLKSDETLIVKTGAVTPDLWNYLISKSTFPPMVSGNTGHAFVSSLGRPFLNTVGGFSGFSSNGALRVFKAAQDLKNEDVEAIKKFFEEARDPASSLSQFYAERGSEISRSPDKVESVLSEVQGESCIRDFLHAIAVPLQPSPGIEIRKLGKFLKYGL